jgi:hypothetical protein
LIGLSSVIKVVAYLRAQPKEELTYDSTQKLYLFCSWTHPRLNLLLSGKSPNSNSKTQMFDIKISQIPRFLPMHKSLDRDSETIFVLLMDALIQNFSCLANP